MAELSGFEVLALVKEIDSGLRGAYVNNIYSLGEAQILRLRRPGGDDSWLVVSPSRGAWISQKVETREETSDFTTRLRGELERAKFLGASQEDLDRVYRMSFEGATRRDLVLELMPPGNLIVVDGEGRVVLASQEVRSPSRRVVRGEKYSPPVQRRLGPEFARGEDIARFLKLEPTVGKAIGRNVSIPRKYVAEALRRLSVDERSPSDSLRGREEEAAGVLRSMVAEARDRPFPVLCPTSDGEEVFAFKPSGLEVSSSAGTMSELCDSVLLGQATSVEAEGRADSRRRELEVTISRLRQDATSLLSKAKMAREAASKAQALESAEEMGALMKEVGLKAREMPASGRALASLVFDRAKDLEREAREAEDAARTLERRLAKVEVPRAREPSRLRRRKAEWYEKFRWFYTTEGRLAVGGRDAQSNSLLVRRHLEQNDVVYHADLHGSPFFVLKNGAGQTDEEVREVAQATVSFSSAWKTALGSADAYWVLPDQVSASAPSGEYLPKGSFAIKGKKNFVGRVLVELAVGMDPEGRVIAGPEMAVKKTAEKYVVVRPHREKVSETAKKVLVELNGGGTPGAAATLDDVIRALPSGGAKLVRKVSRT